MAGPHFHKERLAGVLQREITQVIARELRDPRIPAIVTVTRVHLGADLRNATVYISLMEQDENCQDIIAALNKAAPYIQHLVAGRIAIKHFPRIYFKHDDALEHTQYIHKLLEDINNDLE